MIFCRLFVIVVFVSLQAVVHSSSWKHQIVVDQKNGSNNSCLLQGNITVCPTINSALTELKHDSTVIKIRPGCYELTTGEENTITGKQDIAIIGSSDGGSIITCFGSSGLAVSRSSNVRIDSIVLGGCGKKADQVIIRQGYDYFQQSIKLNLQAGLYFSECSNVALCNVELVRSKGIGLLLNKIKTKFDMVECTVSYGLINEFIPTSVFGGVVINEGDSYFINNSNITHNGYHIRDLHSDNHCSPAGAVGGLVTLSSPTNLFIDSCMITDNNRGLLLYKIFYSYAYDIITPYVEIHQTTIRNHQLSKMVDEHKLSLSDVQFVSDTILIVTDSQYANQLNLTGEYSLADEQYSISTKFYDEFELIVNCPNPSISKDCVCHVELFQWNFDEKCYIDNIKYGKCSSGGYDYTGHCPLSYSSCINGYCSCSSNHNGTLCSQCVNGYGIAINSPYLSCVPCNDTVTVIKGWALLVALEFIPVAVMVTVIAVLNVDLNQGSLNAYILFCQLITMPFPSVDYPAWFVSLNLSDVRPLEIFLLPLSIWNLGFINYPSCGLNGYAEFHCWTPLSICISQSTTPLASISLWYVIALYPLVLFLGMYCAIIMYDRGYRCVVCVVRPVHRLLARFWRMFGIQPSLTHTFASLCTLCFTQLAATSLKILHFTKYQDMESGKNHTVFFYDGSQPYFCGWHGFAGFVAIVVLVGLIVAVLYLTLYPFQLFQRFFNKIRCRKDFLVSVTDVFTGPYKDGTTQDFWDYRYFAGIHFAFRLVIMTFYYIPLKLYKVIAILESICCAFFVCVIVIFRPYKRNIHNFTELLLFLLLIGFAVPSLTSYSAFIFAVVICPIVVFIVVFIVSPYCLFGMIRKCFHCYKYHSSSFNVAGPPLNDQKDLLADMVQDDVFADRLVNPNRYDEHHHCGNARKGSIQLPNEEQRDANYGTFQ